SWAGASRTSRVTPGVSSTMARRRPTRRLNRVDLPTLGRPTMATLAGATRCGCRLSSAEGNEPACIGQDVDGAVGDDRAQPYRVAHVYLADDFAGVGRERKEVAQRAGNQQAVAGQHRPRPQHRLA